MIRVTGTSNYVSGNARMAWEKAVQEASFKDFFRLDSFIKTEKAEIIKADCIVKNDGCVKSQEQYKKYLETRYGAAVSVQDVGKDQRSMDSLGMGTVGTGNVVIAPNILEQMMNDANKAAYYEGHIKRHFDTLPRLEMELSAMGHEIHSCGIVIHADGTVTRYVCGDLKPEVRARIEARVKAEQEAKLERRRFYAELGEQAALKRKQELKGLNKTGNEQNYLFDMNIKANIYFVPLYNKGANYD